MVIKPSYNILDLNISLKETKDEEGVVGLAIFPLGKNHKGILTFRAPEIRSLYRTDFPRIPAEQ